MNKSRADCCRSKGVRVASARRGGSCRVLLVCAGVVVASVCASGCNAIKNGWMDPTVLGDFQNNRKLEIRASLTLDDTTSRLAGATQPTEADLQVILVDHKIMGGDSLAIEINELRQRQVPFQVQIQVSPTGFVNLPVVGEVRASGLTPAEFQEALVQTIQDQKILVNPDVTVNPLFLQHATYSIFGIGVSASNNAPLRAGTFPIRRPDLRMLDAINNVGGLNEFVTEVYIFRNDQRAAGEVEPSEITPPSGSSEKSVEQEAAAVDPVPVSPEDELLQLVEDAPEATEETDDAEEKAATEMDPGAVDPYVFVDGRFVRNPQHIGETETLPMGGGIPVQGTVMPTTNWSRLAGEGSQRVIVVSADRLRSGDPSVNVVIRSGDVIRIVQGEIGVYYVMGQVNRAGPFAFNSEEVTLKAAIAAAGGLSGLAWPDRCTVYRRSGGSEQVVQVNLDRIFAGLDDDFIIRRRDIINVGTHPFAPFLQRIRSLTLPNPTATVGYGFTYARNFADVDSFAVRANPNNQPDLLRTLLVP